MILGSCYTFSFIFSNFLFVSFVLLEIEPIANTLYYMLSSTFGGVRLNNILITSTLEVKFISFLVIIYLFSKLLFYFCCCMWLLASLYNWFSVVKVVKE